jgi:hypothetical protein
VKSSFDVTCKTFSAGTRNPYCGKAGIERSSMAAVASYNMPLRRHNRTRAPKIVPSPAVNAGSDATAFPAKHLLSRRSSLFRSNTERAQLCPGDAELIRREVRHIRKAPKLVYTTGSPGVRGLLAVPALEATNRFLEVVGQFQLVSALVLSGILQPALQPVPLDQVDEDVRGYQRALNMVIVVLAIMSVVTCATTCWVSQAVAGQTEDTVGAALAKSVRGFHWAVEIPSYVQVELVEAAVVLASYTNEGPETGRIVLAVAVVVHFVQIVVFFRWTGYAFPTVMVPWVTSQGMQCLLPRRGPKKAAAKKAADVVAKSMERNHGLDNEGGRGEAASVGWGEAAGGGEAAGSGEAHGGRADRASAAAPATDRLDPPVIAEAKASVRDAEAEAALDALVECALPGLEPGRRGSLVDAFVDEGLTAADLRFAGAHGADCFFQVLEEVGAGRGGRHRLRVADRLALLRATVEE